MFTPLIYLINIVILLKNSVSMVQTKSAVHLRRVMVMVQA